MYDYKHSTAKGNKLATSTKCLPNSSVSIKDTVALNSYEKTHPTHFTAPPNHSAAHPNLADVPPNDLDVPPRHYTTHLNSSDVQLSFVAVQRNFATVLPKRSDAKPKLSAVPLTHLAVPLNLSNLPLKHSAAPHTNNKVAQLLKVNAFQNPSLVGVGEASGKPKQIAQANPLAKAQRKLIGQCKKLFFFINYRRALADGKRKETAIGL